MTRPRPSWVITERHFCGNKKEWHDEAECGCGCFVCAITRIDIQVWGVGPSRESA